MLLVSLGKERKRGGRKEKKKKKDGRKGAEKLGRRSGSTTKGPPVATGSSARTLKWFTASWGKRVGRRSPPQAIL